MSPRRSVVEAGRTRRRILDAGLAIASAEGLEALTIGRLATGLGMSKAGVIGHFGTKEALQLAVVDVAVETFLREVPERARGVPRGLPYLRAVCEAWISYLERAPGGCFFMATATEFDGRDGPVRDAVAHADALWQRELRVSIWRAVNSAELPPDTDIDQLLYEIVATMLALNHYLQLRGDRGAPARARRALARHLGSPAIR
ncbi:TetR/AcrR family transcriptional regulator [Pseudonocardia sp. CA-107938]|uniref:TetR/AcrR family transcriptional regulator n=1 Tax=Pseudonocardia sp. CA-107938 TaxID=3240021 RepID=UPI003D8DE96D